MIEIPECVTLSEQFAQAFLGKKLETVVAGHTAHGFTWYNYDHTQFSELLSGKALSRVRGLGGYIELVFEDVYLTLNDGATPHYLAPEDTEPEKHQLLIRFEDGSGFYCTVRMYAGIQLHPLGESDNIYYLAARDKPSPLSNQFTRKYFQNIVEEAGGKLSAKALLATEQRIPGLGNGVVQDILFTAGINPQRKLSDRDDQDLDTLFSSVTTVLAEMTAKKGRDTEKDLYGIPGGYQTILSNKTKDEPCPQCGSRIVKKAYLGGNVYFCPVCQPL